MGQERHYRTAELAPSERISERSQAPEKGRAPYDTLPQTPEPSGTWNTPSEASPEGARTLNRRTQYQVFEPSDTWHSDSARTGESPYFWSDLAASMAVWKLSDKESKLRDELQRTALAVGVSVGMAAITPPIVLLLRTSFARKLCLGISAAAALKQLDAWLDAVAVANGTRRGREAARQEFAKLLVVAGTVGLQLWGISIGTGAEKSNVPALVQQPSNRGWSSRWAGTGIAANAVADELAP